jgi:glycosyltransferase involved in cell wall biosynthesis
MADFFAALLKVREDSHFLWLTPGGHDRVHALMKERGVGAGRYTVRASAPRDVASYLSAADAGVAFIKRCFSKLASSPTKTAEYLACGLPVVINAGVGDSDLLITEERVGALVSDFSEDDYRRAASRVFGMLTDVDGVRAHTRRVAERLFDVRGLGLERYARLYANVIR